MAKKKREQTAGVYHVTTRGVDRRAIYKGDDTRLIFERQLGKTVRKRGVVCHAFCQMNNHYHMIIETLEDDELAPALQYLNSSYARIFNETVGRTGYLFERPYRSFRVDTESYALELCRYVVLNPVRVHACESAHDYRWSSYRATIGLARRPEFLTTDWILGNFDDDPAKARVKYALFVEDGARAWAERARAEAAMSGVRTLDMAVWGGGAAGQQPPASVSRAIRRPLVSNQ